MLTAKQSKGQILSYPDFLSATVLPSGAPSQALSLEYLLHSFMPSLLPKGVHCRC